jgi:UTP:GlnB (protein PII) uridylyltransferase
MPFAYRALHSLEEVRIHHGIVLRRANAAVHVERCVAPGSRRRSHPPKAAQNGAGRSGARLLSIGEADVEFTSSEQIECVCVVADDRPGLMSLISSVVLAHSLDVVKARVYCRIRPGGNEAVDFIHVRAPKATRTRPVALHVSSIRSSLNGLLTGKVDFDTMTRRAASTAPPPGDSREPELSVYFSEAGSDVLVVESTDRRGLLLSITLAVFQEGLTIIASDVTTLEGVARDEFLITELDGSALSEERRRQIVEKVRKKLRRAVGV